MRNSRVSDDDASAVLRGEVPKGRGDLESLVRAVDDLRVSYSACEPQASAELRARFAGGTAKVSTSESTTPAKSAAVPHGGMRAISGWLAGLGLAAKLGLIATTASAGVMGAGAAGVLPPPAQHVFDEYVVAPIAESIDPVSTDDGSVATTPVEGEPSAPVTDEPTTTPEPAESPVESGAPDAERPGKPEAPGKSGEKPGKPATPGKSGENPGKSGQNPGASGTPGKSGETPGKSGAGRPGSSGASGNAAKPDGAGKPHHSSGSGRADR